MTVAHIGIDDTDSNRYGMCTTYIGAVVDENLRTAGYRRVDLPRLVRLNPTCPFKTRGNGAVHLTFKIHDGHDLFRILEIVEGTVEELAEVRDESTNPGIVVVTDDDSTAVDELTPLYVKALRGIVEIDDALASLEETGGIASWFKNIRGVIGALAAIGAPDEGMVTYELLAYRSTTMHDRKRSVDVRSVQIADLETWPWTYDNYDWYDMEMLIAPHTPCPVLLGIRGMTERAVIEAYSRMIIHGVERTMLYRTNQGSGLHALHINNLSELKPYTTVIVDATVSSEPKLSSGGHVYAWIRDLDGDEVRVAAYEPTKHFRKIILALRPGDRVRVLGSYKPHPPQPPTLNLELVEILELAPKERSVAPKCPVCGSTMKSAGKSRGYRCKKCGYYDPNAKLINVKEPREVIKGLYVTPPRAHRHLTKPMEGFTFWGPRGRY